MVNEKRLIYADDLRQHWLENGENEHIYDTNAFLDSIDEQPTVDAVEVVHGRWIEDYDTFIQDNGYESEPIHTGFVCSVCGRHSFAIEPYCHCGAKMDGGDNHG